MASLLLSSSLDLRLRDFRDFPRRVVHPQEAVMATPVSSGGSSKQEPRTVVKELDRATLRKVYAELFKAPDDPGAGDLCGRIHSTLKDNPLETARAKVAQLLALHAPSAAPGLGDKQWPAMVNAFQDPRYAPLRPRFPSDAAPVDNNVLKVGPRELALVYNALLRHEGDSSTDSKSAKAHDLLHRLKGAAVDGNTAIMAGILADVLKDPELSREPVAAGINIEVDPVFLNPMKELMSNSAFQPLEPYESTKQPCRKGLVEILCY
jgi:hypothetical protein